jgi:DNA (cytosine-5)-methyltransferase 1
MMPKRVLDICCGAGLLSYGFLKAGFEIDRGIDNWRTAVETYNKYVGTGKVIDITDYFPTKKDYDAIIVGATPCQDFTRVNVRRNIFGKRAQLVLDFCRLVAAIQPEAFVFENVIGLSKWAEVALSEIKGYKTTKNIVNAMHYGVPQHRRRKIFIGCKTHHIKMTVPLGYQVLTVEDAFSTIQENWGFTKHRPETIEKFSKVRSTSWISKEPTSDYQGVVRLSWRSPACAVVNVKKAQILHPGEDRVISIAEAAALQGFPEWYIPVGKDTEKAVQVANAVPPKLAYHIATKIQGVYSYNPWTEEK